MDAVLRFERGELPRPGPGRLMATMLLTTGLAFLAVALVVVPFVLPVHWGPWEWTALGLALGSGIAVMAARTDHRREHVAHMD
jgi:thiol:disulfide interchange protein